MSLLILTPNLKWKCCLVISSYDRLCKMWCLLLDFAFAIIVWHLLSLNTFHDNRTYHCFQVNIYWKKTVLRLEWSFCRTTYPSLVELKVTHKCNERLHVTENGFLFESIASLQHLQLVKINTLAISYVFLSTKSRY